MQDQQKIAAVRNLLLACNAVRRWQLLANPALVISDCAGIDALVGTGGRFSAVDQMLLRRRSREVIELSEQSAHKCAMCAVRIWQ